LKSIHFMVFTVIGLLGISILGFTGKKIFAQKSEPEMQSQDRSTRDQSIIDSSISETDNVDLQCGDQNIIDEQVTIRAADTNNMNIEEPVGDLDVVDNRIETESAGGH
jgi:hypothetical protein